MIEFTDGEKDQIRKWGMGLDGEISFRYATTEHSLDDRFKFFVDKMNALVPGVRPKKDSDAMVPRPTLFVDSHVAYQAIPLDRELLPFLDILKDRNAFASLISPDVIARLEELRMPALIKVYITPHCPYCPSTVSTLLGLAAVSDQVKVTVIDGELFMDAAQKDSVSAAPTVILDDQFRWTGSVDAGELVTLMLDRDPVSLGAEALKSMVEEGNAEGLAEMMNERKKIFPSFIELLIHPRWSVRLGAMVTFETLVEEDSNLAGEIVEPLIHIFPGVDDMVKGDLLHVMGESGNEAALPFVKKVFQDETDEEVKAAAEEAIEKLTAA